MHIKPHKEILLTSGTSATSFCVSIGLAFDHPKAKVQAGIAHKTAFFNTKVKHHINKFEAYHFHTRIINVLLIV